ncbi:unnamed protein product, partial [Prorocentrum cordatum]
GGPAPLSAAGGAASPQGGGLSSAAAADECFCAGHLCEHGLEGHAVDLPAAAEFYQLAAEAGHAAAQWRLGELLEYGRGVGPDEALAANWYRLSARAGNAQAQSALALLLEEGRGCARDDAEAARWHLAAAELQGAPAGGGTAQAPSQTRGRPREILAAPLLDGSGRCRRISGRGARTGRSSGVWGRVGPVSRPSRAEGSGQAEAHWRSMARGGL